MEQHQEFYKKADAKIKLADHIVTMTYPMVHDPRLLLASMENIFLGFSYGMQAVLQFDLLYKRIEMFPSNFQSKFEVFRDECAKHYKIEKETVELIHTLKELMVAHKKSPVEFSRKDAFVICDGSYHMTTITREDLKKYIKKAKVFNDAVLNILNSQQTE